jgi:Trk K+ transport system NAD-binding subunit
VAVLMFIVRPINVLACTWRRSHLTWREKTFLAWIAPRGIVAAAVASFFALEMDAAGMEGGTELRAMVFLVIAVTVTLQGLTGGPLARLLGVRRPTDRGWAILGAGELGLTVGRLLREAGEEVTFLDSNADATYDAQAEDFPVVFGNALEETTMLRAGMEGLAGCIGLTLNEEVNLLFAAKARSDFKVKRCYASLHLRDGHITTKMIRDAGVDLLFGGQQNLRLWDSCVRKDFGKVEAWTYGGEISLDPGEDGLIPSELHNVVLPMIRRRGDQVIPIHGGTEIRSGDEVTFLLFTTRHDEAATWLMEHGWQVSAREAPAETGAKGETDATPAPA